MSTRGSFTSFLKPGWVITTLLVIAFSYFAFTVLAPWQLGKNDRIVERNAHIEAAYQEEPGELADVLADGVILPDKEWHRVRISGTYLPAAETILRLRNVDGAPTYQALTPFAVTGGPTLLVNRGYVTHSAHGGEPEIPAPPSGEQTIVGLALSNEMRPRKEPLRDGAQVQVYGINTEMISEVTGLTLARDYLQLAAGSPGELTAIPLPQLERGSHLSYGLQWIAFGIMAPLGLGYLAWMEISRRRATAASEPTDKPSQPVVTSRAQHSRDLSTRYGGRPPGSEQRRALRRRGGLDEEL